MEAIQYKCPNCNAELKFMPETQDFGCEYCLSHFTAEDMRKLNFQQEESISEEPAEDTVSIATEAEMQEFQEHTSVYHCSSCGADIIADDDTTATFCYYCHNPVILAGRLTGDYRPSKIIGFRLTRENAEEVFKKWCGNRRFLPKDFNSASTLEKMTGLYVPFWVADCDIVADYEGIGKKIRTWRSGNYRYTETKEYRIVRNANIFTDGIPADGESKIDDLLMESIEPFNYDEAQGFHMSYLSGFFADKYDVDKVAVAPRIKMRATSAARGVINSSITSYSTVSMRRENYDITQTKWQYMMLPVWFMTYKYKEQLYSFAINGQSGKIAGTPPLDKLKLKLFSMGVGLATGIAAMIIGGVFL